MKNHPHSVWRTEDGVYTVTVEYACFESMLQLAGERAPVEVGTSLVGSYTDDGHHAYVRSLAPLTPDSQGGRFTFQRGVAGLRDFFRKVFKRSRGMTHYVGEWHSHVGGAPIPSGTDDTNTMEIARDPSALCPECILVILALREKKVELGVYVYSRKHGRLTLARIPRAEGGD